MPLGPALRGYTGRQLVLRGEALFILDGVGGLTFTPAATWEILGGPYPESWTYKATINGPTQSTVLELASKPGFAPDVPAVRIPTMARRWAVERLPRDAQL